MLRVNHVKYMPKAQRTAIMKIYYLGNVYLNKVRKNQNFFQIDYIERKVKSFPADLIWCSFLTISYLGNQSCLSFPIKLKMKSFKVTNKLQAY